MSAFDRSEGEGAFDAFANRVEAAIRRKPVSEVVARRARKRAEAMAEAAAWRARVAAATKTPRAAYRRRDWSAVGMNVLGLIAVLVFMATWALIAIMGGLWGVLLGWLPASILASFCVRAWPLVLAVVVIAAFGIAAVVRQNAAPQRAPEQAETVTFDDLIPAHPQQGGQASAAPPVAQDAAAAPPAVQPVAAVQDAAAAAGPAAPVAVHDASWSNHDERVAAAVRGAPLVDGTSSELNALVEECPSHRIAGAPATGFVCEPLSAPGTTATPAGRDAAATAGPSVVTPNASSPVPETSGPTQIAQR